jgi:phosphate-selective porin OprO/OprP
MGPCAFEELRKLSVFAFLLAISCLLTAAAASAQDDSNKSDASQASPTNSQQSASQENSKQKPRKPKKIQSDPTFENTISAAQSDEAPKRQLVHWNEYRGPHFTIRVGGGFLYEIAAFAQDQQSKEQIPLEFGHKIRDFRILLAGSFPSLKKITWCAGLMYDAPTGSWFVRQTGVMIPVRKLWGNLFIGRSKEGFSLNKVMNGYDGWTMERFTMNDATVPLLADGIKWLGYSPKHGFLWNVGYYNDVLSKGQSFSSYSSQVVARLVTLPIRAVSDTHELLHLGLNLQYGNPVNGQFQLRSRPEAFPAPYFVDTGKFSARKAFMVGPEVYYRRKSLLFGSEYWFEKVSSPTTGNPVFHGGDIVATWLLTGETRTYNTVGGFFRAVSPARSVFDGGRGAWELVLRQSFIDLNSGTITGGRFWRFTPMINWYLSDNVRLEVAYGYGHLDRFDLKGYTQFFQSRIQLQL